MVSTASAVRAQFQPVPHLTLITPPPIPWTLPATSYEEAPPGDVTTATFFNFVPTRPTHSVHDKTAQPHRRPDVQSGDIVSALAARVGEGDLFVHLKALLETPAAEGRYRRSEIDGATAHAREIGRLIRCR